MVFIARYYCARWNRHLGARVPWRIDTLECRCGEAAHQEFAVARQLRVPGINASVFGTRASRGNDLWSGRLTWSAAQNVRLPGPAPQRSRLAVLIFQRREGMFFDFSRG